MEQDFLLALPKIELHAHLNGSLRDTTIQDLLTRKKTTRFDLADVQMATVSERSLPECFVLFDLIHNLTDEPDTTERTTREMIEDFAAENCRYMEIRTSPRATEFMTAEEYVLRVIRGVNACKHLNIMVKLLLSINRAWNAEQAMTSATLAVKYKDQGVVGMDLSGNPAVGTLDTFMPALMYARENGLKLAIHFAEVPNKDECTRILRELKPDRLGHACCLDKDLFDMMVAQPVPLEVCLTSNVITKSVPCYNEHHFKAFFEANYPMCLCTDDKGVFCTTLTREYRHAAEAFALSNLHIFDLARSAIDHTFASESEKAVLRKEWEQFAQLYAEQLRVSSSTGTDL
eukprot:TRINITY_DN11081_c0_g1_i1.p1 TRINITY_DN11081_c0_g1~~TRINITY_DN11081_c0_g1_i1.p1  ORF type:complete len:355 (+),score=62.98 TRINITY_DN11081_c0_g1_i1:31-1065(+)